ncbi:DUF6701 domain-containing protein [Roseateles koreensis]|uniref:DUF6701 domain-containing protein n=1 Tax=Roseateles koreensis TaxID=2987526 RepID=A0ABT5KNF9_9BURK|nr:DUF6701 domain-containing protein [Roseateles koreensis]MDC8784451.1 hypothetical protein [Roseateles koreensis]
MPINNPRPRLLDWLARCWRSACHLIALALLCLAGIGFSQPARATAYAFPGNLPAGCTAAGSTYTCGSLTLGYTDTVSIGTPKPATLKFTGTLSIDTSATINAGGAASDLNLQVAGTLTTGYQTVIMGNVTAGSVNATNVGLVLGGTLTSAGSINLGDCVSVGGAISNSGANAVTVGQNCVINGGITSASGAVSTDLNSQVKGTIATAGNISVGQASVVTGNVSSTGGTVALAYQGQVTGYVSAKGQVTLGQATVVGGDVTSTSGAMISLDYQGQVGGSLNTTGSIVLAQNAVVSGKINGGTGSVSFGFSAKVVGDVTTTSGTILFNQSAIAQACVRSSSSANITLEYLASIHSVCCGGSCSNSCVTNNTSYPMPPACMPTPIADYHFDECSYNGNSGEVVDNRGGYPATAVLGATTGGNAPVVLNRYANLTGSTGSRYITPDTNIPIPTDWSVSTWVKTPFSTGGSRYHILASISGGSDLLYTDDLNGLQWGVYTPGNIVNGTFKFSSLAAGWHHVGLVGTGGQTALYIDGSYKETVNLQARGNLGLIGASWDVDVGTHEGLNAQMDEFMVFNSAISSSNISTIYTNQKAGKNYDGTSRNASSCTPVVASFVVNAATGASTCSPQAFTVTAKDGSGSTITSYTGTITLTSSTGRGDFSVSSGPAPSGTFTPGAANSGQASYTFAAGDAGVVNLKLSQSLAQNVVITVQDSNVTSATGTSASIQFRDNAFVWSEDLNNKIAGTNIVVAGRNHDLQVALWKKDATTGVCSIATDYTGSRNLKLWRTDNGSSWTAPSIVSPALTVPAATPGSNNLNGLSFTAGVATLTLATTDIGKYTLNLLDDSTLFAATSINGSLGDLTVRPFAITVSGLTLAGVSNPAGSAATDTKWGAAGATFSATLGAYRWSASADSSNTGTVDASATLSQVSAGGLTPGFSSAVTLSPSSGSQTPTGGVLGTLSNTGGSNPAITGFSGGTVTVSDLKYSEVGSFLLNTNGVVNSFLGTTGLTLNATVFTGSVQNNRLGRFVPAGFAVSSPVLTNRLNAACSPASTFTYLGEAFKIGFTLTAQNAQGATTQNYTGSFAKLALTNLNPAGIQGSTPFKTGARLTATSSGTWGLGQSTDVQLSMAVSRLATPDGPFAGSNFGIAPADSDGVVMNSYDLDTDSPANGNDHTALKPVSSIQLRFGQLRLQNAIGSQNRDLSLPLLAQYWDGANFITNTLDSCTSVDAKSVNFGNYRKTLNSSDGLLKASSYTLTNGSSALTLTKPGGGRTGSLDVSLSLSTVTDQSCLQAWTPGVAATLAAGLSYLQGPWCGAGAVSYNKDPSARATFGLYRGTDSVVYQRENY